MATKNKKVETKNMNEQSVVPKRIIIARKATAFRKFATLLRKYEVGMMPVGVAYTIVLEVNNGSGTFYKLNNGMYITAVGDYVITNQ